MCKTDAQTNKVQFLFLFDLILYVPVNSFSVICMSGQIFLG